MAPTRQGFSVPATHSQLALTLNICPPRPDDHRQSHCWARAGKLWSWQQVCGWLPVAKGTSGWQSFSWWDDEILVSGLVSAVVQMAFPVFLGWGGEWGRGEWGRGKWGSAMERYSCRELFSGVSKQTKFPISRKALSKARLHHLAALVCSQ